MPVSTGRFSIPAISLPRRSASGTPRRLMPISTRSSLPLLFSTISWARRTSVRSISEADISLPFTRRVGVVVFFAHGFSRALLSSSHPGDDTKAWRQRSKLWRRWNLGLPVLSSRVSRMRDTPSSAPQYPKPLVVGSRAWIRAPSAPPPTANRTSSRQLQTVPNGLKTGVPLGGKHKVPLRIAWSGRREVHLSHPLLEQFANLSCSCSTMGHATPHRSVRPDAASRG